MSFTYWISSLLRLSMGKLRPRTGAVILAAGSGTRMGTEGGLTKQLMLLDGVPVLVRSIRAFDACEYIDEIVIVARREERKEVALLVKEYNLRKVVRIVSGGATRRLSALRGLEALSEKCKFIAIHDAARCLVTPAMIADVAATAYATRAASAACASHDTIKIVNRNMQVIETPDRSTVYRAQTPQIFDINLYRTAAYSANTNGVEATDDNRLVERVGHAVKLVDTSEENIKLTTPLDLAIAEVILRRRGKE